tara:strand:- start:2501 stop:2683 length:183 start_codon:yes stop_codon:yes gene_type:complete
MVIYLGYFTDVSVKFMLALKLRRVEVHINKGIKPICSLEKYFEKKYPRFKLTFTTPKNIA